MTYLEVLQDIGAQVADPDLDSYKERAKDHFLRALAGIITVGEFTDNDVKGYVKLKTDLTFSSNPLTIAALNVLTIIEIMPDPQTPNDFSVYLKEFKELNLVSQIAELQPQATEVFVYQVGFNLYAVYKAAGSNFIPASDALYMKYVEDIDGTAWTDSTDLTATPIFFTDNFIRRGINIAAKTLLEEVRV